MITHIRRIGLTLLCAMLVCAPAAWLPARADTPVGWQQLGLSRQIELLGTDQVSEYSVPVPANVKVLRLTGLIGPAAHTANAYVDVVDGRGVLLATIPVPAGGRQTPFDVNLANATPANGVQTLRFSLHNEASTTDSACGPLPSVTLTSLATVYSGPIPNPSTVADFVPGYLDQVVIWAGPNPSQTQQQAALDLVAALTYAYRPIPVRVDVSTSATRPSASANSRIIEIRDGAAPGITVDDPGTPRAVLVISGSADTLLKQTSLFVDDRVHLAQTSSATVESASAPVISNIKTQTFEQLGMTGSASVFGTTTINTGFDAGAFGLGAISSASLHLRAHYTPVSGAQGTVVIRSGSTVLGSAVLDKSGALDTTVAIPAEVLESYVGLALEVRYIPDQQCSPVGDTLTFAIDPDSTISVDTGGPHRGGFAALPMAFTPDFKVGLQNAGELAYASQAVNLLAQQSSILLRPRVVSLADAISSGSGAIVTGGTDALTALQPPLLMTGGGATRIGGDPITTVNLNGTIGAVEAFTQNDRAVVALTANGADGWQRVNASLDYIRHQDSRWASLSGDVVATGAANQTVALTVREGGPLSTAPATGTSWHWWVWLTAAAAIVAVLVVAEALVLRRRRAD